MTRTRTRVLVLAAGAALAAGLFSSQAPAHATTPPAFTIATVGAFGGEPSLSTDTNGVLYDTTPSGPATYRSTDGGNTWTGIQSPDNNSGDDCLNTDSQNSLYWCNLGSTTVGNAPLQADVWKSTSPTITTCTTNCSWAYGNNATTGGSCSTSCNPFGVDRQWVASYIAPGHTTSNAEVVLMYHDFYGPSHIWVNISQDGGATFGAAQEVLSSPAVTPGAITNTVVAEGYTFCNTIPAGVGVVPPGNPHAGRIFVSWIASDAASDGTGCNVTQAESFHTMWVSYSDDSGATWTPQMAFDAGIGHDSSTPFIAFTLDNQGNPYLAFAAPGPSDVAPTCGAESAAGTVQSDATCSYNLYVVWSHDGGATWDGGGGGAPNPLLSGSAATAYEASPVGAKGTDVDPTIAAGDPGKVDVGWVHTDTIVPTNAGGKFLPLGCDGGDNANGIAPANYPPRCHWDLFGSQSLDLLSTPATATWSSSKLTAVPMHYGDICNLGIACAQSTEPLSNTVPRDPRHLLDFNQEVVDPTTGCAHIAYVDDNAGSNYGDPANLSPYGDHLVAANQVSGPSIIGTGVCGQPLVTPEAPAAALLALSGVGIAAMTWRMRRRRLRALHLDG